MRFAAVTMPKSEPMRSPAAEFVRKLLAAQKALTAPPAGASPQGDAPPDLDQRVRLAGEW
jgi:hypothetical protein